MDYKELVDKMRNNNREDNCHDCALGYYAFESATAITDLLKYKDAIDRMGRFGTMFVQYSGDPRGMIGEIGDVESGNVIERAKDMVMHYEMIVDVDMNVWRPVLEDRLQFLIRCMTERAEAAEARCETLEKMVKEYQDTIVPGYRERAEKAERERDAAVEDISDILASLDDVRERVGIDNADADDEISELCSGYCSNAGPMCYKRGESCKCENFKWRGQKEE